MNLFNRRFDLRQPSVPSLQFRDSLKGHASVVQWQGKQLTLRLSNDRFGNWKQAHDLGQQMVNLLADDKVSVLRVDLAGLTSIGSEALTQFARAHYHAGQLGKQVVLENVSEPIRNVFHVTRLDRLYGLIDDRHAGNRWDGIIEAELLV